MGFFESFKRLANGEPVFRAEEKDNSWDDSSKYIDGHDAPQPNAQPGLQKPNESQGTGIVKGQASTFPVVVVKRTRAQLSGNNQNVYCSIINRSNLAVEVGEIRLNGSSRKIGGHLRPGEEREWLCFSGPRRTSEAYKEATLDYKVEVNGDYFQSIYDVEYQLESDKTYSVEELHWRQPIRDIYG